MPSKTHFILAVGGPCDGQCDAITFVDVDVDEMLKRQLFKIPNATLSVRTIKEAVVDGDRSLFVLYERVRVKRGCVHYFKPVG